MMVDARIEFTRQVLVKRAAARHFNDLQSNAYSENRLVVREREAQQRVFHRVALVVRHDVVEPWLLPILPRLDVMATCHQQPVAHRENLPYLIIIRRQRRHSAGPGTTCRRTPRS